MEPGCSSFSWETRDGHHLLGRTYDHLGDLRANSVIGVPPGAPCLAGLKGDNCFQPGRYGYTGMAVLGFGEPILVDGVNTAGLMGALLHYPGYVCYEVPEDRAAPEGIPIHPGRLLAWLLSSCAGVEEAAEVLSGLALRDDLSQGSPLAAHYILSDRSGETIVIEPDREGLRVHRRTIGVLTNSPDYSWHCTNLRTYVGVTNCPKPPRTIAGLEIREFGERLGGGFGLPGDFSSPSRFVRTAFAKEYAVPGEGEEDGVSRMFRAFALVEIPEGMAEAGPGSGEYAQTLCISVMCAESGIYYFSPAWNRRISAVRPQMKPGRPQCFDLGEAQDINFRN